jgi:PAS domain-containing protein
LHATAVVKDLAFNYVWQNSVHRRLSAGTALPENYIQTIKSHDQTVAKSRRATGFFERVPANDGGERERFSVRFPILDTGGRIAMLGVLGCDFSLRQIQRQPDSTIAFPTREGRVDDHESPSAPDDVFNELILTTIPAVAMIKSVDSSILWANPAYENLTARPLEELIGKRPDQMWEPEIARKIRADDEEIVMNGKVTGRFHRVRTTFERFTIRFPIFGETGRVVMIGALGLYAPEKSFGSSDEIVLAQPHDVALGRRGL